MFRFAAPEAWEESADLLLMPGATAADWAKVFALAEPLRVGAGLAVLQAGEGTLPLDLARILALRLRMASAVIAELRA